MVDTPTSLWLCDEHTEEATDMAGYLVECQDGCARPLDHDGACHPREHAGDTCQACGRIDRLTEVEVENVDPDVWARLATAAG